MRRRGCRRCRFPSESFEAANQFYFATPRGELGYAQNRHDFNKLIWRLASPKWNFDDATYDRTAASFDNPDHVAVVIHNYRWGWSMAIHDTPTLKLGCRTCPR